MSPKIQNCKFKIDALTSNSSFGRAQSKSDKVSRYRGYFEKIKKLLIFPSFHVQFGCKIPEKAHRVRLQVPPGGARASGSSSNPTTGASNMDEITVYKFYNNKAFKRS